TDVDLCNMTPAQEADLACQHTIGALEEHPIGDGASNQACFPGDSNYIDSDEFTPDEMKESFTCVAKMGESGSDKEIPLSALVQGLNPTANGPGQCNEGFFRSKESILLLAALTDEQDQSNGFPAQFALWIKDWAGGGSNVVPFFVIDGVEGGFDCPASVNASD